MSSLHKIFGNGKRHVQVKYSDKAESCLRKLKRSNPNAAKKILETIKRLTTASSLIHLPNVSAMRGKQQGYMRAQAGNLRIIFKEQNGVLEIAAIDKRNDDKAYREFKRKNS